jgi:hypothetical protein
MTRLVPAAKATPTLEELKPYNARITEVEVQPESKFGTSLRVDYQVNGGLEDEEVRDYINFADPKGNAKLGKSPTGAVSRFREFCNAVGGRPVNAEVSGFDPDRLEIDWPDGRTVRITAGTPLRVSGELRDRSDGDGQFYKVVRYRGALEADTA